MITSMRTRRTVRVGAVLAVAALGVVGASGSATASPGKVTHGANATADIAPFLEQAAVLDAALDQEADAIAAVIASPTMTATGESAEAGWAVWSAVWDLQGSVPAGITGDLRDKVIALEADLYGRYQGQDLGLGGTVYREYPEQEVQGDDDVEGLRRGLAFAESLDARHDARMAAVASVASVSAPVRSVKDSSTAAVSTLVMRAMARSVPRACGDGSLHAWSARHLTVKWTGAGDDNRVGTVSTPGRKGGVPVRVGGILSGIPILDFDACEVQTKLN